VNLSAMCSLNNGPVSKRRFPQVRLKIIEGLYPSMEAGLREGTVDFYLGASPQSPLAAGLQMETLFQNTRMIFARKGHPLAHAASLAELAKAEWLTTTIGYNYEEDLNELFRRFHLPAPKITMQVNSALSVMVALAYSDLLAMLPKQWNDFSLAQGALQAIHVKEHLPAPSIVLIRRPELPLTPAAEFFCDLLRRHATDASAAGATLPANERRAPRRSTS
jgi:LysR family transcriptional regulator, regulator of abg operon